MPCEFESRIFRCIDWKRSGWSRTPFRKRLAFLARRFNSCLFRCPCRSGVGGLHVCLKNRRFWFNSRGRHCICCLDGEMENHVPLLTGGSRFESWSGYSFYKNEKTVLSSNGQDAWSTSRWRWFESIQDHLIFPTQTESIRLSA